MPDWTRRAVAWAARGLLADIADALNPNDLDQLLVHGPFLEARFGGRITSAL